MINQNKIIIVNNKKKLKKSQNNNRFSNPLQNKNKNNLLYKNY